MSQPPRDAQQTPEARQPEADRHDPRPPAPAQQGTDAAETGPAPMAGASTAADFQARADAALGSIVDGLGSEEAALALAVVVNRAVTRLHNLGRSEATARKGQPEWPVWAQLQNASRALVLQASTCRALAARLAGRRA